MPTCRWQLQIEWREARRKRRRDKRQCGSLEIFLVQGFFHLPNDPRFRLGELHQEIRGVDDQVAQHRKVFHGLHAYRARRVVRQKRRAGQLGNSVHRHSAAPAHSHAARPAKRQRPIEMILDVVQGVEHHPLFAERDLIGVKSRFVVMRRIVPRDFERDSVRHTRSPFRRPARPGARRSRAQPSRPPPRATRQPPRSSPMWQNASSSDRAVVLRRAKNERASQSKTGFAAS